MRIHLFNQPQTQANKASDFYHLQTMVISAVAFPFSPEDAKEILFSFDGNNPDHYLSGENGWETMVAYMKASTGKLSQEDFNKHSMNLSALVLGLDSK